MIGRNRQVPKIIESRIFYGNLRLYSALFGKWNEQFLSPLGPFVAVTKVRCGSYGHLASHFNLLVYVLVVLRARAH